MATTHHISLRNRMLLSIGGAVLLAFALTVAVVATRTERDARTSALDLARQTALTEAARISDEIHQSASCARNLAAALSGIRESGKLPDRAVLDELLRRVLEENPKLLGVWNVWQPGALDGRDAEYVNKPGNDAAGRYVAYWNRVGGQHLEGCVDYDGSSASSEYYQRPFKTGVEVLMEPVVYKIAGADVMVVSYCVPIRVRGAVVGVAGVDFSMELFQQMVAGIKPGEGGYGFLVAGNGALVAYPDPAAVGKPVGEFVKDSALPVQLRDGAEYRAQGTSVLDGSSCVVIGQPIRHGGGAPWMLAVATPEARMLAAATRIRNICLAIGVAACLLVVALVWFVAYRISTPLAKIAAELSQFSDQLASSAGEVSAAGSAMAQGAAESAATLEETSASMQEITAMITRNAQNSARANEVVHSTERLVVGTTGNMQRLKQSMDQISAASQETQRIVKTIDEIAFQTNILALNAAVEAARAGSAGAGFAVVADEVRGLAQRAAVAARDTSAMIEGSVGKIGAAVDVTSQTESDFRQVDESSKRITSFIAEIAQASGEQKSGIGEIDKAIGELNQVVQKNAAVAQQSAAAAQEMNAQAAQLQGYAHDLAGLIGGDVHKAATPKSGG
jgi:methyl-accepting chemotaxis protein